MPPSRPLAALLALPLSLAAGLPALALAGGPEPPPAAGFSEAIDVDVVEVEAFVTDRSGKPVSGLSRGDFELRVDGKPAAITNFYAASRASAAAPSTGKGLQDLGNAVREEEGNVAGKDLEEVGRERQEDAHSVLVTLGRLVDSLAGLRGRKALLYVSGELAAPDGDAFLSGLARRANAAGVTIYGLGAPEDLAGLAFETTKVDFLDTPAFQGRADDLRSTLEALTLPTGGLTGVDLNRPAALLDRIRDDFSSYYSLGFTPDPAAAAAGARPHRLEVRRGLTVRFPATYVRRTREERLAGRTQTALLLAAPGAAQDNPLGVRLGFERDELAAYGRRAVTVLVTLPLARVALQPGQGVHEGKVEILLAARDSTGHDLRMRRITMPIHVPDGELAAALARRAVAYRLRLELPPGSSTIALGVRDELGGGESTVATQYVAGALATARAAAPPPGPPRAR